MICSPLSSRCSIVIISQCLNSFGEFKALHEANWVSRKLNVTPDGSMSDTECDGYTVWRDDNGSDSNVLFDTKPELTLLTGSDGFDSNTLKHNNK